MENLIDYLIRISPAIAVVVLVFILVRPGKQARVVLYILTFILLRDALTPSSLWRLGVTDGIPWIRLFPNHVFLLGTALSSLTAVGLLVLLDRENSREVVFLRKGTELEGWVSALVALAVLLSPFVLLYRRIDLMDRGGVVDPAFVGSILIFALAGNLLEELLFRGYVYNVLKRQDIDLRAGIVTGFVFCLCHAFLATTVTSIGTPLLLFTLWEGVICGIVGARYGVLPATLVHGGAIFGLTSGLF